MTFLLIACASILLYTYAGYPLLIGLLARLRPRQKRVSPSYEPSVTACVAAYNTASYLDAKLASLVNQDYPHDKLQILVYSDGSDDGTDEVARTWSARDPRIELVRGSPRAGKPTALNVMRELARGELLLLTDSRQTLEPNALRALVSAMSDESVGCATGNLVLKGQSGSGFYWRYENWIRQKESEFRSVVGMTGPIAMVRREGLYPLPRTLILDDVWIPMRLRLEGKRVVFVPEAVAVDMAFDDQREFGRKTRTLAGNYQLLLWHPELLLPWKNPSWLETVSHKVLRLVCPWALAVLLVTSFDIALLENTHGPFLIVAWTLLLGQALFYGLAALGSRAGRLPTVARTFVVLNLAAQVGLWRFLLHKHRVTW
jgi:cellulose synthase/poly-beta-1,6-N-acetylglucosamine synthase-like glycosyltransferase